MGKMPGEATKREKCHLGVQGELTYYYYFYRYELG